MNNPIKKSNVSIRDIHERIYKFVIRVLNLIKYIPKTSENIVLIGQITRSATSMGANDQEADGAINRKDFVAKYSIVRKEGKEINYWLKIISDTNPKLKSRMQDLIDESEELIKIVSTIIFKTKR
ncbi:MAG TPA: four helix bundle protein [Patescibacteria group bacterium]|nr:four helix bundle protein [Patescibacteria group bacterium]